MTPEEIQREQAKYQPLCICGQAAVTTIVQIPACAKCSESYEAEGKLHLPMMQRKFFTSFLDKAREQGNLKATEYAYHGY